MLSSTNCCRCVYICFDINSTFPPSSTSSPRGGDKPSTTLSWHSKKSSSKHIHHQRCGGVDRQSQCGFKVRFFRFNEIYTQLSELEYRIVWWLVEWMIVVGCLYQRVAHNKAIRRKELDRFFFSIFSTLCGPRRWLLLSYNNKAIYSTLAESDARCLRVEWWKIENFQKIFLSCSNLCGQICCVTMFMVCFALHEKSLLCLLVFLSHHLISSYWKFEFFFLLFPPLSHFDVELLLWLNNFSRECKQN